MSPRITLGGLSAVLASVWLATNAGAVPAPDPAPADHDDKKWTPGNDLDFKQTASAAQGAAVYGKVCSACHDKGVARAPAQYILRILPPAAIYRALTTGAMRVQGEALADEQKRAVAEFLTGRVLDLTPKLDPPTCTGEAARFDVSESPIFPAWGISPTNARSIASGVAGVDRSNVSKLHVKWAMGFDGATRVRSQPALAAGAMFLGSEDGRVLALDRATGCKRWAFQAGAEVRTGIVISPWKAGDATARPMIYFGDVVGNAYGVDAFTGALVWKDRVDEHASTTLSASPALHAGRLYMPVSSLEEAAADGKYPCCTFRGSVVAYQATTGKRLWKRYFVDKARATRPNSFGVMQYGPSGTGIWNTPSIDERRGLMYLGTGDNYSTPTTATSDSVVALELRTGRIRWIFQGRANDAWNVSCSLPDPKNCPVQGGPDYDFGAATILATAKDGRQYVLAGQKSGWVYALSPDSGHLVWKTKVGRGGIVAGVYFGMALNGDRLFVPINDAPDGRTYTEAAKPGLYALDLHSGAFLWKAPLSDSSCAGRPPQCTPGIGAAVTATDELVMTGAGDGWVRIFDAATGAVLWQYDTLQDVPVLGGGTARGGSISGGAGVIAAGGLLIVESGYGFAGRMPGNLMVVFGVD